MSPTASPSVQHVHFGAGRFGLGMVVDLCERAGLTSTVLNKQNSNGHHPLLSRSGRYRLIYDNNLAKTREISVTIRYYKNQPDLDIVDIIANPSVSLVTTSVTRDGLRAIAPLLAKGIERRHAINAEPIYVLACENLCKNSTTLAAYVQESIASRSLTYFKDNALFCDTVVDRVCANIAVDSDIPQVPVESFHSWVVAPKGRNSQALQLLAANGLLKLASTEMEFDAHELLKYWCLNAVQLAVAAYGFNFGDSISTVAEALQIPTIRRRVRLLQAELNVAFLSYVWRNGLGQYFSKTQVKSYGDTVLQRLQDNRADSIDRILKHSSSPPDRVVTTLVDALNGLVTEARFTDATAPQLSSKLDVFLNALTKAVWFLDVHEILNRIVERFVDPQRELLADPQALATTKAGQPPSFYSRPNVQRFQLDDAIQAVLIATDKFARQQYDSVQLHLAGIQRELPPITDQPTQ